MLLRVLEAATWAPSAHNRQPWRFVVLTDPADRAHLARVMADRLTADLQADGLDAAAIERDVSRSRGRITGAAVVVLVGLSMVDMEPYPDARRQGYEHDMAMQGVAMAAQNLLLAAHGEGLGGVWVCAPLFCQDVVRDALDLPADYEPQGAILLGYPAEQREKTRAALETRVTFK